MAENGKEGPLSADIGANAADHQQAESKDKDAGSVMSDPPKALKDANQEGKITGQQKKHWLDYITPFFAAVAAAGAIAAAFYSGIQAHIAEDAEQRSLRAYVHIAPSTYLVEGDMNGPLSLSIEPHIKVFGQTPAGSVSLRWTIGVLPGGITSPNALPSDYMTGTDTSNLVIPPGADQKFPKQTFRLSVDDATKIRDGGHRVYIYGTVTYLDVFRQVRWSNFCSYLDLSGAIRGQSSTGEADKCKVHNGSDWNKYQPDATSAAIVSME